MHFTEFRDSLITEVGFSFSAAVLLKTQLSCPCPLPFLVHGHLFTLQSSLSMMPAQVVLQRKKKIDLAEKKTLFAQQDLICPFLQFITKLYDIGASGSTEWAVEEKEGAGVYEPALPLKKY